MWPGRDRRSLQPDRPEPTVSRDLAIRALGALVHANLRYWTTVAPLVRGELAHWQRCVEAVPDLRLRRLAERKLREERFNTEAAATFATLTPPPTRPAAVRAIVAVQVAYDYLDLLTEQPWLDPLSEGRAHHRTLTEAFGAPAEHNAATGRTDANGYVEQLAHTARTAFAELPTNEAVREVARAAAARCAEAQLESHAAARNGMVALEAWAVRRFAGADRPWPEQLAGSSASVLCLHALIAAAGDPRTTRAEAECLDELYFAIGALTMLDSLGDRDEDLRSGESNYTGCFADGLQMAERLAALALEAIERTQGMRHRAHHVMTLAGVIAYYGSARADDGAAGAGAGPVVDYLRRELWGLVTPALALMKAWRLVKRGKGGPACATPI